MRAAGILAFRRRRARAGGGDAMIASVGRRYFPEARQESPPGSLTPEARHQLDESLTEGVARVVARKRAEDERSVAGDIAGQPEREFPYGSRPADGPDTNAFRRLGATFTARPAAETRPMAAITDNTKIPPPPPAPAAPAWADAADREAMERTIGALQDFDFAAVDAAKEQEGMTYAGVLAARAAQAPEPDLSRAERFTADMRFRGGLPLFRKTAAAVGWRGLNEEPPRTGWVQYTVARWDQQARVAIAAATEAALAEVHADFDAARQRVMAPGPATAGAR